MKKILSTILAVVLSCLLIVNVANVVHAEVYSDSRDHSGYLVVNTTAGLNVRTGPGTNYRRSTVLPAGSIVWTDWTYCNGFYQIKTGRFDGLWISSQYVCSGWYEGGSRRIRTNGANLRMRSGPGTKFSTITSIPNGTSVSSYYTSNGWVYVRYGNRYGWVSADYTVRVSASYR